MIIVCSLSDHANVCESVKSNHLISVIDPGFEPKTPTGVTNHLKLGFDDIVEIRKENMIHRADGSFSNSPTLGKQVLPNKYHINKIIEFISNWNDSKSIVIHCWCGVSRSMATAIFILCKLNPNHIESNVKYMRSIAPHANPNKLMVSLFEEHLGIPGQINEALYKYPHTVTYDCELNFAPVSLFKINELKNFQ